MLHKIKEIILKKLDRNCVTKHLVKYYRKQSWIRRLMKFGMVDFAPWIPTLIITAKYGVVLGGAFSFFIFFCKFVANDLWTWRKRE